MNWSCGEDKIKKLWGLDPAIAFLNHGSYGSVPFSVQKFQSQIRDEIEKNPVDFLARKLPSKLQEQRVCLGNWLNVEENSLAFVSNATAGVGSVLSSMHWSSDDEIIFHSHGYGWVRQALANLSARSGVVIREAKIPWPALSEGEVVSAFEAEFSEKTRLLICDHISSPTAIIFPVAEIVASAKKHGIPVLVDGAHAPGLVPIDVSAIDADFYTGNLHKWFGAPRGSAFLFVKKDFQSVVRPESLSYSGGVTHHHHDSNFCGYFDWTGTRDFSSWLSLSSALEFNEFLGWNELFKKRKDLLLEARDLFELTLGLQELRLTPESMLSAMCTIEWPLRHGVQASVQLARNLSEELLNKNKVEVPIFCFDNRLYFRVSAQAYTRLEDYIRLSDAIVAHRFSAVRKR